MRAEGGKSGSREQLNPSLMHYESKFKQANGLIGLLEETTVRWLNDSHLWLRSQGSNQLFNNHGACLIVWHELAVRWGPYTKSVPIDHSWIVPNSTQPTDPQEYLSMISVVKCDRSRLQIPSIVQTEAKGMYSLTNDLPTFIRETLQYLDKIVHARWGREADNLNWQQWEELL